MGFAREARGLAIAGCVALWVGACTAPVTPALTYDPTGILLVGAGDRVQSAPPTEALRQAVSDAFDLALANGEDLGYPWFDPSSGDLVLSAVTPRGRQLILAAGLTIPHRIRDASHGVRELQSIQDAISDLRAQGAPGSHVIYGLSADDRDNRTLLTISEMERPLLDYLAAHYPVDALAVRVDPSVVP